MPRIYTIHSGDQSVLPSGVALILVYDVFIYLQYVALVLLLPDVCGCVKV